LTAGKLYVTTVADALVSILEAVGIEVGFGIPGGQTLPFYQAARARGFRHVLVRDERNGACAADAYARVSGKVGFCDATVGPGVTNLVSGLAEAYASSIPVLVLIADIDTRQEHLRHRAVAMQAMDQRALLTGITKWFGRVAKPEMLVTVMDHALRVATTGRPGPVVVEVPEEVMAAALLAPDLSRFRPDCASWPRSRPAASAESLQVAVAMLSKANRPILLAGGGAVSAGAYEQVLQLATECGIPVVTSLNGKGIISDEHPLAFGPVGLFGTVKASHALQQADVVLALGTKFTYFNTFTWKLPAADQAVIHVDVDAEEFGRAIPAALGIVADAREAAGQILTSLKAAKIHFKWLPVGEVPPQPGTAVEDSAVAPEQVVESINTIFGADTVLVSDASLSSGWTASRFLIRRPGRYYMAPRGIGGLGWACGAAIGASLAAAEGSRVVVVAGDGAAAYWLGEIETAVRLRLPITFIVLNNTSLGWSVQIEQRMGFAEVSRFSPVNYAGVGIAMGASGSRACSIEEVRAGLRDSLRQEGPYVLDVISSEAACATVPFKLLTEKSERIGGAYSAG
jgi:acetolactate synthase I/II/III large subunit